MTIPFDAATVSVFVAVSPEDAFAVFTEEIDRWWRTGPRFRMAGKRRGAMFLEGRLGGRVFETFEVSSGTRTFEVGTITCWEPPLRLTFGWRASNFAPHEGTTVDVRFQAQGRGTLVTVRHEGFASLPDTHPVRHGHVGADFTRWTGMWWGELMTSLREHVAARPSSDR